MCGSVSHVRVEVLWGESGQGAQPTDWSPAMSGSGPDPASEHLWSHRGRACTLALGTEEPGRRARGSAFQWVVCGDPARLQGWQSLGK